MAANKFATMVHSNTNKITLILIYAVLEWTLILLLLLNSLFSYLIIKFTQFFALKPPCLWCSTLHTFFEPQKLNSHRDLLCELHSKEVSNLGFCPNHQKLAEIKDLCEDCLSSHLGFQSDVNQSDGEDESEVILNCSCCGLKFDKQSFDCFSLIQNFWDVLEETKKRDLIIGTEENKGSDDQSRPDLMKENLEVRNRGENLMDFHRQDMSDSNSFETALNRFEKRNSNFYPQDLEFFFDFSGNKLVPVELVDSTTEESQNISEDDEEQQFGDYQRAQVIQEHHNRELESMELEETENSLVFHAKLSDFTNEESAIVEETQALFIDTKELQENATKTEEFDSEIHLVHEEAEVSIGTEIPVVDSRDEEPSMNSHDMHLKIEKGFEPKNLSENDDKKEEEKIPDTPGSVEGLNQLQLHKKLLTTEGKESGVEESFDGSVMSELDGGDPINTAEKLRSALKAERKALQALYVELEEERGASAVAASETMAMINRLQEEKAAMQMEALQYQRMMEEQSEYDQEALQLLNELMTKREKELEIYRKKVAEYEAKEQMLFLRGCAKIGVCSASCSHSENEDGLPVEKNYELNRLDGNQERSLDENAPEDVVLALESSLADFEEERLSILEQLRVLEEKLFSLSDEEDQHFVDVRPIDDLYGENEKHYEKRLLPLFDAISIESDDGITTSNGHTNGLHSDKLEHDAIARLGLEKKRIDVEAEADQVYERLQALEANREFLKYCIGSLKKGDRGMRLLQEILQHLRDLRNVDLRAKTFSDETLM